MFLPVTEKIKHIIDKKDQSSVALVSHEILMKRVPVLLIGILLNRMKSLLSSDCHTITLNNLSGHNFI